MKTQKIDLPSPATGFSSATVSGTSVKLNTSPPYVDDVQAGYLFGHLVKKTGRDGLAVSHDWGYNTFPTAEVINASNNQVETPSQVVYSPTFPIGSATYPQLTYSFYQTTSGSISLSLPTPPAGATVSMTFALASTAGTQGSGVTLCNSSTSGCGTNSSSKTFSSMPPGQYLLTCNFTITGITTPFNYQPSLTYQGASVSSTKEYFFEGFEENTGAVFASTGSPSHTGKKYWQGNYPVPYSIPSGSTRNFQIQYWSWANGQWNFHPPATYTGPFTVPGPVDDVRIFPSDAQMTTYTYDPGVGMTSKMNTNGIVTSYYYDKLGRLSYVTDQNSKVIKQYQYTFTH
jgi:YD repeat-containing protein